MNNRMQIILKQLMGAREPVTSEQLASHIQVTSRTIRNDIKQLDHYLTRNGAIITALKGRGYRLDITNDAKFKSFLKRDIDSDRQEVPVEPEDRMTYLVKTLLLQDDYVKLDELADNLFISRSTIQNDIRDVKIILDKYDLKLEKKPNFGLKLIGKEKNIRFCMAEYLFDRNKLEFGISGKHLIILPPKEIEMIRDKIMEYAKEYKLVLSDVGLQNLVIHIAIACKRIRDENYVSMIKKDFDTIKHQKEYKIADKLIRNIEKGLSVNFPDSEIAYVAMHLLGTKMLLHPSIKEEEVTHYIDSTIYTIVHQMIKEVDHELGLSLTGDKELVGALALHLKPAMNRFHYGMNLRNPMLEAIKTNYPFAFEAAVIASKTVEKQSRVTIDENEIGYLALHFGAAIERSHAGKKTKRCLLVCATGAGSAQLLYYKLRSQFGDELRIVGTTEYYNLKHYSLENIDFIISTIPIQDNVGVPSLVVSTILGNDDLDKIQDIMMKRQSVIRNYLKKDYVFLQQSFQTREAVIEFLGRKLVEDRLVDESYITSVLAREEASPTSFGNYVAIPHPLDPKINDTFWMICTLKKPVDWGGKQVQFVCLLNVSYQNKDELKPMYDKLVRIVDRKETVQQLINSETIDELVAIFESVN
ncbi:transcription antiterminator [Salipaludibacillus agaradhaerens]|uniref:BglG family transcription antiterminator n=1 Tax=Salipaludibacillus agaradhaerens TaxID=76935 RepID=UPI00215126DF|nr:BglG family transcription antiterminator [Salipaludibacillus agaradhaerens]MCR6105085.1 transcription antiterminator [Salipaludibacillus agaradhaerens]MCR6117130.1 transcription antiterminator [Salipaludibacillus agaradhaerens]